jgi:hypothetical protein
MKYRGNKSWRRGALVVKVFLLLASILLPSLNVSAAPNFRTLNLTAFFNQTNAAMFPQKTTLRSIPFNLGGAVQITGMDAARFGEFWPAAVTGVPVNQKAGRLHLLIGAYHGARDGSPLANVVLRYKSGETRALRLAFGVHTRNIVLERDASETELADPNSHLAWQTNAGRLAVRLHQTALDNPLPDEEIAGLDFVSLFSRATPVLFAATCQDDATPALLPPPKTKILQRAGELTDAAWRREWTVRVSDASGQPLTNTTASLSLTDDARTFFFGQFRTDGTGRMVIAYPPQDTVALHLRVNHPGFAPATISLATQDTAPWPEMSEVRLERGQPIGGLVVDADGKPVAGAAVIPFQITPSGTNQFTRQDLDLVTTDTNGKWSAHAPVATATNLTMEITHPDFHPATIEAAAAELLASRARAALRPHVRLAGQVRDMLGNPIRDAMVYLYNEDLDTRSSCAVDSDGRYKFIILEPSNNSAHLVAIASNFAPTLLKSPLNRPASALNLTLFAGKPFTMRLTENDDTPLAGVKVTLFRWDNSQALPWSTITDEQGRFAWKHAPSGSVTWRFEKTGFINHTHSMTLPMTSQASFTYNRPIRIAGRVLDAITQRPIDQFRYRVRYTYSNGSGTSSGTGRRGTFNTSLSSGSGKYTEVSVMVEATDYEPLTVILKPPYGMATNDFLMRKAKLIDAFVVTRDGKPVPQAEVLLLPKTTSAYMDIPGKFRRSSSYYDVALTDQNGRAGLTPKLEVDLVLAAHPELGFAQISTNDFHKTGRIVLEPWGHVKGVLRVGDRVEPDHFVAIHTHFVYDGSAQRSSPPLYMYYRLQPQADGRFVCDAVPPGERMVQLRYYAPNESGTIRLSHNQPVTVQSGETNEVMIGGTGRTVTGQVVLQGLPDVKIDGRRGEYVLRLQPGAMPSEIPPPLTFPPRATPAERQRLIVEHQARIQEVARNRARANRFLQRSYVLLFDDNNKFTVPNVPPGDYSIYISAYDPRAPRSTNRTLGNVTRMVKIPEGNGPFDTGTTTLEVR